MNKIIGFFTFLSFAIINNGIAVATTLKDAIQTAYKNSEQVYIKMSQRDLSSIDRDTAISNFLPQISASWVKMKTNKTHFDMGADMQKMINGYRGMMPANANNNTNNNDDGESNKVGSQNISVEATASLSYYKTIPALVANQRNVKASKYEYNEFLESFGLLFIQKYMDVIYYDKARDVYSQMSDTLEKKVKRVSILNKYGTAKKDKVVIAESQYYENEANKISTQSLLVLA